MVDAAGKVIGVLCQSDLIAQQKNVAMPSYIAILGAFTSLPSTKDLKAALRTVVATFVRQIITPNPRTVTPGTSIQDMATLIVEKKIYTLPVVLGSKLVSVLGKEDMLRTIIGDQAKR